jgi:diguanylate cyclase (GGDEF)-like protein
MRLAVDEIINDSARAGTCALALFDMVGFRVINETLGHDAGDLVLLRTAERIVAVARPGDVVARVGGDEFAVLLVGLPEPGFGEIRANAILGAIAVGVERGPSRIATDARCGLAPIEGAATFDRAFAEADQALVAAKIFGDKVTLYTTPTVES